MGNDRTLSGKHYEKLFWITTGLFISVKLLLHFITNTNYELHRDEMLYFNMAAHLSFGYPSAPPLIGFLAFLVKSLFDYSVFGLRLIPALLGAASLFIIAKVVRELGGGVLALSIASLAFLFSPGFLIFDTLFTPNVVEQFLWLLVSFLILRMINTGNPGWWIPIGVLLGIAFLNKYLVLYFIAGFFIALIFSPHRILLNSKYFYYSIGLGMLIILPNLLWQGMHNWPFFFHLSELKKTQMANMTYLNYLKDIFSLNSTITFIWLFGLFALLFLPGERKYRFFGWATVLIILLFMFTGGKGYYLSGLIPFLFAYGGYAMEKSFHGRHQYVNYVVLLVTLPFPMLALPYGLPVLSFEKLETYSERTHRLLIYPFSRWEDGKDHGTSQVYSDMTGWRELAGEVAKAYRQLPEEDKNRCSIYAERNYGYAGAIHFYGKEYDLPQPITFLDSYVLWAPDTIPNGPLIYIFYHPGEVERLFEDIEEVGQVKDPYFRESGLKVFLCRNPEVNTQEVYREMARKEKSIYLRIQ